MRMMLLLIAEAVCDDSLRHTYASLLIERGEHPKYIQVQMGHLSINVTMDTYGHLMKAVNQDAAKRLDEAVFGD